MAIVKLSFYHEIAFQNFEWPIQFLRNEIVVVYFRWMTEEVQLREHRQFSMQFCMFQWKQSIAKKDGSLHTGKNVFVCLWSAWIVNYGSKIRAWQFSNTQFLCGDLLMRDIIATVQVHSIVLFHCMNAKIFGGECSVELEKHMQWQKPLHNLASQNGQQFDIFVLHFVFYCIWCVHTRNSRTARSFFHLLYPFGGSLNFS